MTSCNPKEKLDSSPGLPDFKKQEAVWSILDAWKGLHYKRLHLFRFLRLAVMPNLQLRNYSHSLIHTAITAENILKRTLLCLWWKLFVNLANHETTKLKPQTRFACSFNATLVSYLDKVFYVFSFPPPGKSCNFIFFFSSCSITLLHN